MKEYIKEKALVAGNSLYKRSNLDMAKPATPIIYNGFVRVISKSVNTEEPYYGEENSVETFLRHFYNAGWTVPKLIRAYRKLYFANTYILCAIGVATFVTITHVIKNFSTNSILFPNVGMSILFVVMISTVYMVNNMYMWRIRNKRINARPWLSAVKSDYSELLLKKLSKSYKEDIRAEYKASMNNKIS